MKKIIAAGCIAVMSCAAFAQTAIETERHVTTVRSGGVTTVQTTTVVREYVNYLYTTYTGVNVPPDQIDQLIDLDLQILAARIHGDFQQVHVLVQRQVDIVGIRVVQHIHTYVEAHPVPAAIPVYAHPVWQNNVTIQNNNVNINVDVDKTEIQNSIKKDNVNIQKLNLEDTRKAVKSGKIKEVTKNAGSADTDAKTKKNDATDKMKKNQSGDDNKNATETPTLNGMKDQSANNKTDQNTSSPKAKSFDKTNPNDHSSNANSTSTPAPNATPVTSNDPAPDATPAPGMAAEPKANPTPSSTPASSTSDNSDRNSRMMNDSNQRNATNPPANDKASNKSGDKVDHSDGKTNAKPTSTPETRNDRD